MIVGVLRGFFVLFSGFLGFKLRDWFVHDLERYGWVLDWFVFLLSLLVVFYHGFLSPSDAWFLLVGFLFVFVYVLFFGRSVGFLLAPLSFLSSDFISFSAVFSFLLLVRGGFHEFLFSFLVSLFLVVVVSLFFLDLSVLVPYCLGGLLGGVVGSSVFIRSRLKFFYEV